MQTHFFFHSTPPLAAPRFPPEVAYCDWVPAAEVWCHLGSETPWAPSFEQQKAWHQKFSDSSVCLTLDNLDKNCVVADVLILIFSGKNVIAQAQCRRIFEDVELDLIAVCPDMKGKGLGRRLMGDILLHMKNWGASRFLLEVSTENTPAHSLYKSMGFVETGRRKAYYRDGSDGVLMEVQL